MTCAFKINLCYRDNLFFDAGYFKAFLEEGRRRGRGCRAALTLNNAAFREHALPLADSYTKEGDLYLADLWYYPNGPEPNAEPLVIDMLAREIGYYHVPYYMAKEQGDLVFQVPL